MIHNNYAEDNGRLAPHERQLVDDTIDYFMREAKGTVRICGDDRIERVAEALATCIVESRDLASGPEREAKYGQVRS